MFPSLGSRRLAVRLLIDRGADRTVLSPDDADRLGDTLATLPAGATMRGVGGRTETRVVTAILTIGSFSTSLALTVVAPQPQPLAMPSILGRDVLSRFALFLEERTGRVFLLEPQEADQIALP